MEIVFSLYLCVIKFDQELTDVLDSDLQQVDTTSFYVGKRVTNVRYFKMRDGT